VLIGAGIYGFMTRAHLLRRILAFNVLGSGVFLLLGASAYRAPVAGADPVPQALIITGIVVALSVTALGVALVVQYARETGNVVLPEERKGEGVNGQTQPNSAAGSGSDPHSKSRRAITVAEMR